VIRPLWSLNDSEQRRHDGDTDDAGGSTVPPSDSRVSRSDPSLGSIGRTYGVAQ
jgi:hypothetical protein